MTLQMGQCIDKAFLQSIRLLAEVPIAIIAI